MSDGGAVLVAFAQRTLDGLLEAGPYALVGLGLTLGFGTLRRINLAYGAGAMLGAYVGAWLYARHGVPAAAVLAVTVAVTVLAGLYVEWMCFPPERADATGPSRGHGAVAGADGREVVALAASFALWMQLEQLSVMMLPRHLNPFPSIAVTGEWSIGPLGMRPDRLAALLLALVLAWAIARALERTRGGLAWRAASGHRVAAELMGLEVTRLRRVAFLASCALAGVAACLVLAMEGQVTPMFGMWMLVKGLVAAMIGGLGSVRGVVVGAIVLGVVEAHAQAAFGAIGRDATAWALLLAVLLWRGLRAGAPGAEPRHA